MTTTEMQLSTEQNQWFYENAGQRIGAISEEEMITLIRNKFLTHGALVWRKGFPNWTQIENTELKTYLDSTSPPPLTGDHVNNTLVWVLAFAPILGFLLEHFIAGAVYHTNGQAAEAAIANGTFWYVTLLLNIGLSFWDEKKLKLSGTDTGKFGSWVWLVPVYLFKRAGALKQSPAYFFVWIACFALVLLSAV